MRRYIVVGILVLGSLQSAAPGGSLEFGRGWEEVWRRRQLRGAETAYAVVSEEGRSVVRAESVGGATALYRLVDGMADATSIAWNWKVERSLAGDRDERTRRGDDYAARLFVIFGSGLLRRDTRALCYVWASREPLGATYRSPYVRGVATIVLQSGDDRAGQWIAEERVFTADYRRFFGEEPGPVGAVALLVDTDNTDERATAWYGDIRIR